VSWRADVILLAMGALLAAFFSGAEAGAYVISRLRLRYRAREQGLAWAKRLEALLERMPIFVTATLIWTNLAYDLVSVSCTSLYARSGWNVRPEIAATLTAAPILFIFAELVPKSLFRLRPEGLLSSSARTLAISMNVVRPLAWLFSVAGRGLMRALGLAEPRHWALVSRGAFRAQLASSAEEGGLTLPQTELAQNIMHAGARAAIEAATPVEEMPAFPEDTPAGELVGRIYGAAREDAHEPRAPLVLVHRARRDEAAGVVRLIRAWAVPPATRVSELVQHPAWLDEDASIIQALAGLRRAGTTVGIIGSARRARAVVSVEQLMRYLVGATDRG